MGGFGRMDEKCRRAGGGQCGGDFVADMAGFSNAHDHQPTRAGKNGVCGGGECAVEAV